MDTATIKAAAAASSATYRSFADATRSVLDLLERHVPGATVFLAHLDRGQSAFRIVDTRRGTAFGLRSNLALPLEDTYDWQMAEGAAPRRCNDVAAHPVYGHVAAHARLRAGSYLGQPVELSNGSRVGSLSALAAERDRFGEEEEQLLGMLARVLAHELERESNARDLRKLNETMRAQARGLGSLQEVARALAGPGDARPAICRAACAVTGADVGLLLEPAGRDFVSSAVDGAQLAPVTIHPRAESPEIAGPAFTAKETYFVADAQRHPALSATLVEATGARSALFEPVLREGEIAGVLLLVWRSPIESLAESTTAVLGLVAAQGAVAIEQGALRARAGELSLSDRLTGLTARRLWDEELPRELARARRYEQPLSVAILDLDRLGDFNAERGKREGDRLIKETAALWRGALRDVDLLARLQGGQFGLVLPSCGLAEACDVLERLRESTPREQTASAGVARWDGEEPAELLTLRCREALATAKEAGRDMIVSSD